MLSRKLGSWICAVLLFAGATLQVYSSGGGEADYGAQVLGLQMIPLIEQGEEVRFSMGLDPGISDRDEQPMHEVVLTYPISISAYEITHEQFLPFLEDMEVNAEGFYDEVQVFVYNSDNRPLQVNDQGEYLFQASPWADSLQTPMVNITWYGAVLYCNWLSKKEGLKPCYDLKDWSCNLEASGYRLPTEAEWEYAAQGGANTTPTVYAGSDNIEEVAWYGTPQIYPVGLLEPNELGLYDMSGNVWEWVYDRYYSEFYSESQEENPIGPENRRNRVHRGGAWSSYSGDCQRVTKRGFAYPHEGGDYIGFRVVRAIEN